MPNFPSAIVVYLGVRLNFWKFLAFSLKSVHLWPIIAVNKVATIGWTNGVLFGQGRIG